MAQGDAELSVGAAIECVRGNDLIARTQQRGECYVLGGMAGGDGERTDTALQGGNALLSGGTQVATLIGPAIGGALVGLAGPAVVFAVDAVTFVVSTLTLIGVRARRPVPVVEVEIDLGVCPVRTVGAQEAPELGEGSLQVAGARVAALGPVGRGLPADPAG